MSTPATKLNYPPFARLDELPHQFPNDVQAALNQHAQLLDALAAAGLVTDSYTATQAGEQVIAVPGATAFGTVSVAGTVLTLTTEYTTQAGQLTILAAAGVQVGEVVQYHYLTGGVSAGSELVDTCLQLDTANGLRVVELPVPGPLTILDEWLDTNATGIRYQLDTGTRTGSRVFGPANLTLTQLLPQLAALPASAYADGVKLYAATSALSGVDDATISLGVRCRYALSLGGRARAAFPQPIGAQGLLLNPYFADPFTGDENSGWQVNGGWTRDASLNLAVAQNAQYLYQFVTKFVAGATYRVEVTLVDAPGGPVTGPVYFITQYSQTTALLVGSAPGDYTVTFTAATSSERVHLVGGAPLGFASFSGGVSHFDIVRI